MNLQWLYESFQKILEASANKGVLFCYDEKGRIRKNVNSFSSEAAESDYILREIKESFDRQSSCWETLPPEDFSIPLASRINLSFEEDDEDEIADAIRHYHNVVITMGNMAPSSFARTVERLNSEKRQLQSKISTLEDNIKRLSKQKKQYKKVVSLGILITLLGIGIFLLYQTLHGTQEKLNKAEAELDEKWQRLIEVRNTKDSIQSLLFDTQSELINLNSKITNIRSCYPITITSTSFDFSEGKLSINYSSDESATHSVKIYAIRESDGLRIGTSSGNLLLHKDGGSMTANFGASNFSSSSWYIFEVWIGDKLVGGGRH